MTSPAENSVLRGTPPPPGFTQTVVVPVRDVRELDRFERALESTDWQWRVRSGVHSHEVDVFVPGSGSVLFTAIGASVAVRNLLTATGAGGAAGKGKLRITESPQAGTWSHRCGFWPAIFVAAFGGVFAASLSFTSGATTLSELYWLAFFTAATLVALAVRLWVERTISTKAAVFLQSILVTVIVVAPAIGYRFIRGSSDLILLLILVLGVMGCGQFARANSGRWVVSWLVPTIPVVLLSVPFGVGRLLHGLYLSPFGISTSEARIEWSDEFVAGVPWALVAIAFTLMVIGCVGWMRATHFPVPLSVFVGPVIMGLIAGSVAIAENASKEGQAAVEYYSNGGTHLKHYLSLDLTAACVRLRKDVDAFAGLPSPARPVLYFASSDGTYTLWDPVKKKLEPRLGSDDLYIKPVEGLSANCPWK